MRRALASSIVIGLAAWGGCGSEPNAAAVRGDDERRAVLRDRCPAAGVPERRPAARILRVTRRNAARFVQPSSLEGFRVSALFPLAQDHYAPGLRRARYLEIARNACGDTVARRSWVVVVSMPAAPAASFGLLALYFARTDERWKAWYGWLPSSPSDTDGFFPGE